MKRVANFIKLFFVSVLVISSIALVNPGSSYAETPNTIQDNFISSDQPQYERGDQAYFNALMIRYGVFNDDNVWKWHKGGYDHQIENLMAHYEKHKDDPGIKATSMSQYMRQANGFKQNLRGARSVKVDGRTPNVYKYMKNGKYIMIHKPTGLIVSYGSRDH